MNQLERVLEATGEHRTERLRTARCILVTADRVVGHQQWFRSLFII